MIATQWCCAKIAHVAIWKSRNKNSINDQDVAPRETNETLKELVADLVRKSWNTRRLMEGSMVTIALK